MHFKELQTQMKEASRLTEIVKIIQMLEKENINTKKVTKNISSSIKKNPQILFLTPKTFTVWPTDEK